MARKISHDNAVKQASKSGPPIGDDLAAQSHNRDNQFISQPIEVAFSTPDLRLELAGFLKLIADIRSKHRISGTLEQDSNDA